MAPMIDINATIYSYLLTTILKSNNITSYGENEEYNECYTSMHSFCNCHDNLEETLIKNKPDEREIINETSENTKLKIRIFYTFFKKYFEIRIRGEAYTQEQKRDAIKSSFSDEFPSWHYRNLVPETNEEFEYGDERKYKRWNDLLIFLDELITPPPPSQ